MTRRRWSFRLSPFHGVADLALVINVLSQKLGRKTQSFDHIVSLELYESTKVNVNKLCMQLNHFCRRIFKKITKQPVVSILCGWCEIGQKFAQLPIMGLLDSRMDGTCVNMITKGIKFKRFATTIRGRQCRDSGDLSIHSKYEEGLSETGSPILIRVMSPDHTKSCRWFFP